MSPNASAAATAQVMRQVTEELFNAANFDRLDELVAADFLEHSPMPGVRPDRQGLVEMIKRGREGLSETHTQIHELIAQGDRVAARWTTTGRHTGRYLEVPATGREITIHGMSFGRVAGGKLVEHWTQVDTFGVLDQLENDRTN
ncbi:ester cyclase [Aeromicrobium sp. CTD01-1L150]|uniref:ester cyclase n=1 Tax=Aeromicrobium sp. CTD01-1L150 TaxID=3341830 RepID=UPI0035BFEBF6